MKTGLRLSIINIIQYINECFEMACAAALKAHDVSSGKTLSAERYGPV